MNLHRVCKILFNDGLFLHIWITVVVTFALHPSRWYPTEYISSHTASSPCEKLAHGFLEMWSLSQPLVFTSHLSLIVFPVSLPGPVFTAQHVLNKHCPSKCYTPSWRSTFIAQGHLWEASEIQTLFVLFWARIFLWCTLAILELSAPDNTTFTGFLYLILLYSLVIVHIFRSWLLFITAGDTPASYWLPCCIMPPPSPLPWW